jgi:phosphoribosylpyrophosphate synthetase
MNYPVGSDVINDTKYITLVKPVLLNLLKESFTHKSTIIDIWVKGSSGAILAGMLATHLLEYTVSIKHIKKPKESSHTKNSYLYGSNERVNIIIDDFIETGKTINSINDELKNKAISCDILIVSNKLNLSTLTFQPTYVITTEG